jgi:hypothetical protein
LEISIHEASSDIEKRRCVGERERGREGERERNRVTNQLERKRDGEKGWGEIK